MTWHCIALLALLTGQTWPRCFQSLECCEYCCHPATIRACTTPSVSTSANQNPKYFGKVWQQNKWNFANFLQPPLITCQEMRRPEWKESNVVSSWEPNKPKKRCFSFEPFLFLAKPSCYWTVHTPSCHQLTLVRDTALQVYFSFWVFPVPLIDLMSNTDQRQAWTQTSADQSWLDSPHLPAHQSFLFGLDATWSFIFSCSIRIRIGL